MTRLPNFISRAGRLLNTLRHLKMRQVFFMGLRRGLKTPYWLPRTIGNANPNFRLLSCAHSNHSVKNNKLIFLNMASPFSMHNVQWRADSMSKLWRYNLHYFDYLRSELEGKIKDFLIQNWIEHNPYPCEDAWEPYPASLRIINWIKYFQRQNKIPLPQQWASSLYAQGHYLTHHLEWHIDANHLLKNVIALVLWSHYFCDPYARYWQKRSYRLLRAICEEQFNSDGGHYERSPMYHLILVHHLLDAYNTILMNTGEKPEWLQLIIYKAINFSQIMCKPDNTFPLLKDSANGIAPSLDEVIHYAMELGIKVPTFETKVWANNYLPQSGYFIKKSANNYLLMDVGNITPNHQPGHAHCDALHVELFLAGRSIFTDSGVYCYAPSAQRDYSRSVRAHNTLSINGREQHDIWGEFRIGKRGKTFNVQTGEHSCSAQFKPFWLPYNCNISHKRYIHTEDFSCLDIEDSVEGTGLATIELLWHLAPGLVPTLLKTEIEIRDETNTLVSVIKLQHKQVIPSVTYSDMFPEFGIALRRYCLVFKQNSAPLPWRHSFQVYTEPT
jgi:Heparinase II/III-like protein/Heparinase II/III N-terminus